MSLSNRDVAFASDLVTDKIVGVYEGSFSLPTSLISGYISHTSFSHGFTRPVFVKLLWSSNNSTWNDGGGGNEGIAFSTSSDIHIYTTRSSGTFYYRVIAFWIDNYDSTNPGVPPTVGSSSNYHFDSRLNYQKIYSQGSYSDSFSSGATTETISHGLGYTPNVRVYIEALSGEVWPANFGGASNFWLYDFSNQLECDYEIDNSEVRINVYGTASSPTRDIWYIIYYDEAE